MTFEEEFQKLIDKAIQIITNKLHLVKIIDLPEELYFLNNWEMEYADYTKIVLNDKPVFINTDNEELLLVNTEPKYLFKIADYLNS